jgi:hypothetical protein
MPTSIEGVDRIVIGSHGRTSWLMSAELNRQHMIQKPWSHQDELVALRGKLINIVFTSGQRAITRLLEADHVAIKVQADGASGPTVLFKSDIVEFCGADE